MSAGGFVAWALAATMLLTTLVAGSQGVGWTRMSVPFLLGSMFTPDRDRARVVGIALHLVNGWVFALGYEAVFRVVPLPPLAFGAALGLLHGLFAIVVALPALPGIHPRMARPHAGPTEVRVLEPPGFLGLHYGLQTPIVVVVSHVAFGAFLGLGATLR